MSEAASANGSGRAGAQAPAARRDGHAQRPADPRADLVGGRGAGAGRLDRGRLGPEAEPRPRPARLDPAGPRPAAAGRGDGGHPAGPDAAALRAAAVRGSGRGRRPRSRASPARACCGAQAARASAASSRSRRWERCRRSPRCAILRSPRTTRSSTRRSAATSGTRTPPECPRSTSAAARTWSARCWRSRSSARWSPSAWWTSPGRSRARLAALASVGGAVELFVFAERHPDSAVGRAIHGPGYEIQRLVSTREPTAEQLEVGVAALQEVLRAEQEAADSV